MTRLEFVLNESRESKPCIQLPWITSVRRTPAQPRITMADRPSSTSSACDSSCESGSPWGGAEFIQQSSRMKFRETWSRSERRHSGCPPAPPRRNSVWADRGVASVTSSPHQRLFARMTSTGQLRDLVIEQLLDVHQAQRQPVQRHHTTGLGAVNFQLSLAHPPSGPSTTTGASCVLNRGKR